MSAMGHRERVRARRSVATFLGLATLLMASATACIFEKSNYQGGGRQDQGAEGTTAEPSSTPAPAQTPQPTSTTTTTTATPDSAPPPIFDAGIDG